ncbi:MAG TPA: RpiB/LacA/LacB family sugar-phosphate isomerase [Candidatus Dormibacteraeota bacterium]|jgi:ribose 5-phosphate isomerase B|nr:RpiB/LacA/LacB family sugar-phosphate isomerase [Candidatus Dormibacteraeota bacterium]
MRLVVGGDHAGYRLKVLIADTLRREGHEVIDVGTGGEEPVDFPDVTEALCRHLLDGSAERGVLVCGTGIGAGMAANKIAGIRAALAHDLYSAHQAVEHDDANVLCLGAQIVGPIIAMELIRNFLAATWEGGPDYTRRLEKLRLLERGR